MTNDFDKLESIMRMMTPSSFVGGYQSDITKKDNHENIVQHLVDTLYQTSGGGGVYTVEHLLEIIASQVVKFPIGDSRRNEYNRVISILGPNSRLNGPSWPYLSQDLQGKSESIDVKTSTELLGKSIDRDNLNKSFSVITINTPQVSPQRRDAEKVELFLNSVPGIIMSRCVPYVELELGFIRPGDGSTKTQLQTTSLLKFLLGADTTEFGKESANQAMIDSRRTRQGEDREYSTAGMELFTSPQMLVNLDQVAQNARYTDVLDPMRPLASLMSVTIDVKPTVGVYSYKKAIIQFKLHDRSRLSEISDFVRPQVYTQTTVWLTYGWRHPFEPDNPYANFINNNMLKREAYGVQNAQFSFDQQGQIDVTLELYTKGSSEIRSAKISQNLKGYSDQLSKVEKIAEAIRTFRDNLGDSIQIKNVEIRGIALLNAAGDVSLPDFASSKNTTEIENAIRELERSLSKNGQIKNDVTTSLIKNLNDLYVGKKGKRSAYRELAFALEESVKTQMEEARSGVDPYLMFEKKDTIRAKETGVSAPHPYVAILKSSVNDKTNKKKKRHYASFAKMFSIFIGNALMTITGIDEIQAIFYQFNSTAGLASGTNIAEFPINVKQFNDEYSKEIEQKTSDSFTIEEFLQLMIRTQIDDIKSIAYGYSEKFDNYDKQIKKKGRSGKHESSIDDIASLIGPFQKPQIEVYVETTFASDDNSSIDMLNAFNSDVSGGSTNRHKRILRIHVYDRTLNPYESATKILSNGKGSFIATNDDWVSSQMIKDPSFWNGINVSSNETLDNFIKKTEGQGSTGKYTSYALSVDSTSNLSNKKIKEFVARSIPSIIYGTNASTIISANLATKYDALLTATQLTGLNKNKINVMEPNGSGIKGLPLRVIPAKLSLTTMGCPLINYSQFFFVDFSTGTSLDNVYGVSGIVHTIVPGKFESNIDFAFYDAYGKFESAVSTTIDEFTALVKPPEKT